MMQGTTARARDRRRAFACATLLAFAISSTSCFSDRDAIAPNDPEGECGIPLSAIGPNKVVVAMRNFAFFPDTVRIRPGTEVTWVNCETDLNDPHTATATGVWDSGLLFRTDYYTRRFDSRGQFGYFCVPHPGMRGAVIVE